MAMSLRLELPAPHTRQREVLQHPARFKVVACGRRWGKTTAAQIAVTEMILAGKHAWWVMPTREAGQPTWRTLKEILGPVIRSKNEVERRLDLITNGSVTIKTGDDDRSLRGVGLDLLVLDEAAQIKEEIWTAALRPTLSDTEGSALLLSTPRGRNWFYHAFQRGVGDGQSWASWQFPTGSSPTVKPAEIEDARYNLPESIFRQEYLAEFIEGGGLVFRNVRGCVGMAETAPLPGEAYGMGLDWAQMADFTVIIVMNLRTKQVVDIDRFNQVDWQVQRARVQAMARKWNVSSILAEQNSIGSPLIEQLQVDGLPVEGFVTTVESKQDVTRALVLAFEQGTISIPDDLVLISELESFEATRLPSGKWRYAAPAGMHDDCVIALALVNWLAQGSYEPAGSIIYGNEQDFGFTSSGDY